MHRTRVRWYNTNRCTEREDIMTKKVTDKQQEVLDCIKSFIEEKGYSPTVRDLCQLLNLSSPSTVHVHLNSLEAKGMIKRDALKSRSIILTESSTDDDEGPIAGGSASAFDYSLASVVPVPLVGDVAAGIPILAEQNIVDTYYLPTDIVSETAGFMLKVHGDSMIEAGINDGDFIVVRQQPVANNGEIVVALIEDGATVKRFYKEKDHIRLQPENSSMEPILVDTCQIAGKVVAVFRKL